MEAKDKGMAGLSVIRPASITEESLEADESTMGGGD
jgi:hypothetical protein